MLKKEDQFKFNRRDLSTVQVKIDEFFLRAKKYDNLYAFGRDNLVLNGKKGEMLLTIIGANEKDFNFWSCKDDIKLSQKIIGAIEKTKADHVKIPLLPRNEGQKILKNLKKHSRDFLWGLNLSSVTPCLNKTGNSNLSESLRRSLAKLDKQELTIKAVKSLPKEIKELHLKRWGENRGDSYFKFLDFLVGSDFTESFAVLNANGQALGIQINILCSSSYHYYYSVMQEEPIKGIGTALLAKSIKSFFDNKKMATFSFGRGSEKYKYRFANSYLPLYELKGFYCPRGK